MEHEQHCPPYWKMDMEVKPKQLAFVGTGWTLDKHDIIPVGSGRSWRKSGTTIVGGPSLNAPPMPERVALARDAYAHRMIPIGARRERNLREDVRTGYIVGGLGGRDRGWIACKLCGKEYKVGTPEATLEKHLDGKKT